jgi:PAS domain S-box-containing protein
MTDETAFSIGSPVVTEHDLAFIDHLSWTWYDSVRRDRGMKRLAERAADLATTSGAAVFILEETGKLKLRAAVNLAPEERDAARRQVEQAIASLESMSVSGGIAVAAIFADGTPQGAIAVPIEDENPPSPAALDQLKIIGERMAVAITRARQCREIVERLNIVDGLLDISRAILSERELSRALQMVAERAAKAVKAELTAVGLIDWKTRELHYVQSFGKLADRITGARTPLTKSVRSLVSRSGEPVVINDAAEDGRIPKDTVEEWGIRSLLVVPMKIRKKIIGVLLAANRSGGPFATRDLRVFETIADHGAAAVAHAELHTRAQTALSELDAEKSKIEAVLTQLGDGVVVCDAQSNILMMNSAAERIIGIPAADAVGKSLVEIHPSVFRKEVDWVVSHLTESRADTGVFWEQNIHLPGRRVARVNIRPVFLTSGVFIGTATVLQDITEQVELDEAKTEFISTVAHEIRTPLTALKGSLGLALAGAVGEIEPGLAELMGIAQNNCNRLIRLVDDMLDIAKIETGHLSLEMEIVSVQERVLGAVRQMRSQAEEKQIKLVSKVVGQPPSVVGDGDRIEQVVTNLIANAIKFSPPSSSVEVVVRYHNGFVRVSVRDWGPGIPTGERKKVFEKFYQLRGQAWPRSGGSGLGLAISKGIVEQHGGKIDVKSVEGKGSKFTFLLPVPGEESLPSDAEYD